MIGTFEPIVQEARIVAIALQTLNHRLRLAYRYSSVGCAMNNPERQPPQSADILERRASTQRHASSYAVGISAAYIHSTITAETHAQDIDTRSVASIATLHPVEHIHYLLRAPCPAGILRNNCQGIDVAPLDNGIKRTVSAHPLKISTTKAGTMQEDDDGSLLLRVEIINRGIYPEVVASGDGILDCTQKVVSRSLHCRNKQQQHQ